MLKREQDASGSQLICKNISEIKLRNICIDQKRYEKVRMLPMGDFNYLNIGRVTVMQKM